MQIGETAWNPTGVGKVSLCAGLHGGRWSHRVVEIFQVLHPTEGWVPGRVESLAPKGKYVVVDDDGTTFRLTLTFHLCAFAS